MNATSPPPSDRHARLFPFRASPREALRIGAILRKETVGGALLVAAVVIALVWANSPWAAGYDALRELKIGFAPWHLRLSLEDWAADGLLAVFFFLIGLELKREVVAGDLRRFRTAVIPMAAAVGGVVVPALIYTAVTWNDPALRGGWAIPTATDIAFAVAVLALIGSHLPSSLRIFLLTLAVVDDLIAVAIIAIFYTDAIHPAPLLAAVLAIACYGATAQLGRRIFAAHPAAAWLILLPIGVIAWAFMHASGIHATIAGVLLGFTVPVLHRRADRADEDGPGLAEQFEHRFRPLSAGIAVPMFAFFSAGVVIGGTTGLSEALGSPLSLGIVAALVIGKPVGIVVTTWLLTRLEHVRLDPALRWVDIVGVGLLGGMGFTVSLLVDDLSFASGSPENDYAKVAIFAASVISAVLAAIVLGSRNRRYLRAEQNDGDADAREIPE